MNSQFKKKETHSIQSKRKHSGENWRKCIAKKTQMRQARKRVFQRGSCCKNLKTSVRNSSVMKKRVKSVCKKRAESY